MGFTRIVIPRANTDGQELVRSEGPTTLVGVRQVGEALDALLA
jgi:hypothetical protein